MKTRKEIRNFLINQLETIVKFCYSWLSQNDEILSKITFILHILLIISIFMLIFISHTIYPVFWFQSLIFIIVFIVWFQHLFLHMCVCTSLEIKLGGRDSPIAVDPLLHFFGIPISRETRIGVTLFMTSMMAIFLGLELTARGVCYAREQYGFSNWA
jgi:hypothetical protein